MNDSELLRKYEPVLRFAKSERFFPMAVEPYLEKCSIFPSGPQGVVGLLSTLSSESLVTRVGKLQSGEYYLRFVNDPLIDSDIWIWWAVLSAVAISVGWFISRLAGVGDAILLSFLAPGVIMDMMSNATETVARKAFRQYQKILETNQQPVYYGRVTERQDDKGNNWKSLQYHFFYAFNDWRLAANGINHHEGDWEMVAVYLKNDEPYAVLFSQHGSGALERWENVYRAKDPYGNETTHPIIYTALGSHANYSKPEVIRSASLYGEGFVQRLIYWIDGLIHFLFLLFNPSENARQIALYQLTMHPATALTEKSFAKLRDERDHYMVSLPLELATGDGFRLGCEGDVKHEQIGMSSSYLKRVMSDREVSHPQSSEWKQVLLNPEPGWVQYKGLWGVKSTLREESGPPGPKWERPDKLFQIQPRKRWDKALEWLMELENGQ